MKIESLELEDRRLEFLSSRLTQRFYDWTAPFYQLSTVLFHTRAHQRAVELAGPLEGRTVLEVATGSGALFRNLVDGNRAGLTIGLDLSPGMIAVVKKRLRDSSASNGHHWTRRRFQLQAGNALQMPFPNGLFDVLFNCYLFELLSPQDIERAVREFHRVLAPGGRLLLVNVGDNNAAFRLLYNCLAYAVPHYYGRLVAALIPPIVERCGFRIRGREVVSQAGYTSLVCLATK